MNRRQFSSIIAAALGSAIVSPRLSAGRRQSPAATSTPSPQGLYRRALILDCNSGPPYENGTLPLPAADLNMVRDCGVNVVKWSIGGIASDFAETVKDLAYVQQMIEVHPTHFVHVRTAADIDRCKREGKMGIIFSFESVEMLDGKVDRIALFRNLGVRVMQLSYNRKSPFAAGVMDAQGGGLTALGRQAVALMNRIGVTIDLSHANAATTADAIGVSAAPVLMTHAGCAAVHPHPRNKTDEQLRALANKGGVVGIYDLPYLTASPKQPTVGDYMAHMDHALKIAGEDHVGVGSDSPITPFDTSPQGLAEYNKFEEQRQKSGLAAPEEDRPPYVVGLNMPRRIEVIADELLKRGYGARVTEKVIGANFARVFRETWTTPGSSREP